MFSEFKESWTMFRGNTKRTGSAKTKPLVKPLLYWVTEVGPMVSSSIFETGFLYTATLTGRIFCLDILRKEIRWHFNFGSPLVSSPLIMDDMVIGATFNSWLNTDLSEKNILFSINKNNGNVIWNFYTDGDIFSSPCPVEDKIVFGSLDNNVYLLNSNGEIEWKYKTDGQIWSSPSYYDGTIYFGSDDSFIYSLHLDGSLRWKSKLNGKVRSSSPCLSNDFLYIGTHEGGMYCLNHLDGSIKWNKSIPKPVLSSPLLIKDRIIFATSDCRLYCFNFKDGSKIWEFETGDKIWSSPSISEDGEILFFGGLDSYIYGINFYNGRQEWKFPTMDKIDSSPCLADGMLFIGSRDGILYAFERYRNPAYIG